MRQGDLSMSSRHVYRHRLVPLAIILPSFDYLNRNWKGPTYGAMITLAPETGSFPTPLILSGTAFSQLSSCELRVPLTLVYQEPEWVAGLTDIFLRAKSRACLKSRVLVQERCKSQ